MPGDEGVIGADLAIVASATADEVRFRTRPEARIRRRGTADRDSTQATTRRNVESPVEPGRTYRDVFAGTRITTRLR